MPENIPSKGRNTLFVTVVLSVLILVSGAIALVQVFDGKIIVQSKLQSRWDSIIKETFFTHQRIVGNKDYTLPKHVLHLEFDSLLQLKSWSSNQNFLDIASIQGQWKRPEPEILQISQSTFWHLKIKQGNTYHSYLITLVKTYSIDNEYFPSYVFGQESFPELIKPDKVLLYADTDFPVLSLSSKIQLSYKIYSYYPLSNFYWLIVSTLSFILFSFYFYLLFFKLQVKYGIFVAECCLSAGLIFFRLLMLWLQIPHSFSSIKLFSPEVLAISNLNPSLGDVLLNFILLATLAFRWRYVLGRVNLVSNPTKSALAGIFSVIASGLGSWAFFQLFRTACINSKIYYEVSDIFRLDSYSIYLFTAVLLILSSFLLLIQLLVRLWIRFMAEKTLTRMLQEGAVFVVGVSLMMLATLGLSQWPIAFTAMLLMILALLAEILSEIEPRRLHIPQIIATVAGFAWITNLAISESYQQQLQVQLSRYANRFISPRDLITEFEFDNMVLEIQKDTVLYQTAAKSTNIIASEFIQKLYNIHLSVNLRGYDIHIFLFDQNGLRIDNQLMDLPSIPYDFRQNIGKPTVSKALFRITGPSSLSDYAYLGRFKVPLEPWREVWVQVELQPKIGKTDRLYPQLLLDNSLRQRLNLPSGFSLAVYRNQHLVETIGEYEFPLTYTVPPAEAVQGYWEDRYSSYFQAESPGGRIVRLHSFKRTTFQIITAFSFLVYFYLAFCGFAWGVLSVIRRQNNLRQYKPSFARRIQLILAGMTLLPLLIMGIISTPQFRSFYLQTIQLRLKQDLIQCANLLQQQPFLLAEISKPSSLNSATTETLNRFGQILAADLNLFRIDGRLFASTRPRIFQAGLISENINPLVLEKIKENKLRHFITEETIGKLTYLSGYHVIMDNQYKIIAFLNLPYLSQQDILENQLKQFLAYLINLYVVTLLVVVIAGYFIGRSVTYPLQLLKQRMGDISFGKKNYHTINWESSDEIGAIIHSYNEMLVKLSESEKQLAKSEREIAWREMARQVAHEIKNPLTPMKLGLQHLLKLSSHGNIQAQQFHKTIQSLLTQIDSLTYIANSFSQFAAMPSAQKAVVNLNQLLLSVQQLYTNSPEGDVTFLGETDTVFVWADKDQLMRVFANLVKNGLQAMADYGLVQIILTTNDGSAIIQIADNGSGIPEEIQSKIFEPNFSTKNSGMGLGLAISQKIIEQCAGSISFESFLGKGTTFTVILPIINAEP
ncbi:MAG: hypothetical protein LC115_11430 [Bacteroidia bacterium]|nr:hypothetical protein [Bacteroidia bacterium]